MSYGIYDNVSGTWKEIVTPYINIAGVWKRVTTAYRNVSGTWKIIFGVSVSLDETIVIGSGASGTVQTNAVTATVAGGVAPYSYAWQFRGGDNATGASAPFSASTRFFRSNGHLDTYISTWRVKVTDSVGNVGYSDDVTAELDYS